MDFTGYPHCNNGDVLIMLAPDKYYQLHSEMLRRHAKYFSEHLADGGATLSSNAKRHGETVRWRFDLVERPASNTDGPGVINRVDLDSMARPLPHCRLVYNDLSHSGEGPPKLFGHYDKVFGAMYGHAFDLDRTNATIEELLQDVVGIIEVSKYLGCVTAVAHTVNAALLGQGQVLWRSVQANPFAWVDLALRVRSVAVFSETIIHLVGRWNSFTPEQIASLDPIVRKLCEEKHHHLQMRLTHIECRVVKFYPNEITRPVGAPPREISRMSYANDIYTWMALNLHRHWFTSVILVDQHRHAADGGYWLYSRLAKGGDAYLEKTEVNKFHDKFPMSTRGEHVLDQTLNRVKEAIRPIVSELMVSEANLDQERFPVEYLTCIVVKKQEVQQLMGLLVDETPDWGIAEQAKTGEKRKKKVPSGRQELEEQLYGGRGASVHDDPEMIVAKKSKVGAGSALMNGRALYNSFNGEAGAEAMATGMAGSDVESEEYGSDEEEVLEDH